MGNYCVYIMSNRSRSTLYVGVTNDLERRVAEHTSHAIDGFASRYNCGELVYYEEFQQVEDAIAREKQLKGWSRRKKDSLVESFNPKWVDLSRE